MPGPSSAARVRAAAWACLAASLCVLAPILADAAPQPYRSPRLGVTLEVPATGLTLRAEPAAPDATVRQIQETVLLLRGATTIIRIDLWTGPAIDVRAWFDADMAFALTPESRVSRTTAGRAAVPALRVALAGSAQSYPQELGFLVMGGVRARITWQDSRASADRPIFERVFATLAAPAPAGGRN